MVLGTDISYNIYVKDKVDAIEIDTQDLQTQIGAAGAGLTAILTPLSVVDGIVDDIKTDSTAILEDTAVIGALGAGLTAIIDPIGVVDGIVDNILVDTAEIGTEGAGLLDLGGMSTGMKAEVNAEVDTALTDYDSPTKAELDTAEAAIEAAITGLSGIRKTTFSGPAGSEGAVAYEAAVWHDLHVVAAIDMLKDTKVKGIVITNSATPTTPKYRITIGGVHAFPYSTAGNDVIVGIDEWDEPVIIEAGQAWKVQMNCTVADGTATLTEIDLIELG